MSKFFFNLILFFFLSLHAFAQPGTPNRVMVIRNRAAGEQIQVERIAYFTEKIGLTAEEAQLFWPVYNEMDKKKTALFEERAAIMQRFTNEASRMSDRQIDEQLNRLIVIQQQEMALPSEYDAKFRKVLPARKVMNLYVAEMGFRNYLLQTMQNRRPERIERQ